MSARLYCDPPVWLDPCWIITVCELAVSQVKTPTRAWGWFAKTPLAVLIVKSGKVYAYDMAGTSLGAEQLYARVPGLRELASETLRGPGTHG